MKKVLILSILLLSSILCYSQEKLTNQSIVDLTELGFGVDVIISKINSSDVMFDTSIGQLKFLKSKNVASEIISLMIDKSKIEIESGIFINQNDILEKIEPTVFAGTKSSIFGAVLTAGIASAKVKSYINNAHSSNKINSNAITFIFQFEKSNKNELGSGDWWFKMASSTNEFVLTELKVKSKSNQRELETGKVNGMTGNSQIGIDSKNAIELNIENLGDGKYKVSPIKNLKPGEYCFFYQGTIPAGGYSNQSIFDFSVQ